MPDAQTLIEKLPDDLACGWPSEEVALAVLATDGLKLPKLLDRLDALSRDREAEALRQRRHAPHDGRVIARVAEAGDERAVDLEPVDREALQVAEDGVAGPEVVNRELDAELLDLQSTSMTLSVSRMHRALGDLRASALWGSSSDSHRIRSRSLDEACVGELPGREIDAQRERCRRDAPRCQART